MVERHIKKSLIVTRARASPRQLLRASPAQLPDAAAANDGAGAGPAGGVDLRDADGQTPLHLAAAAAATQVRLARLRDPPDVGRDEGRDGRGLAGSKSGTAERRGRAPRSRRLHHTTPSQLRARLRAELARGAAVHTGRGRFSAEG